jgi:hypothetical protein
VREQTQAKVVRSYRLVFRRRWRIFRIQGWRIPLPGGVELRLLGYWLCCLVGLALLARVPLLGGLVGLAPASLRLLALPLALAWLMSRWEVDGRPPHRALLGLICWRLRPRQVAALRRVPRRGAQLAPLGDLLLAPDLGSPSYPRGRVRGPVRLLLRYPVGATASRRRWRLTPTGGPALHSGKTLEVPADLTVSFEPGERR